MGYRSCQQDGVQCEATTYLVAGRVLQHQPEELVIGAGQILALLHCLLETRPALGYGAFLELKSSADWVPVNLAMNVSLHHLQKGAIGSVSLLWDCRYA